MIQYDKKISADMRISWVGRCHRKLLNNINVHRINKRVWQYCARHWFIPSIKEWWFTALMRKKAVIQPFLIIYFSLSHIRCYWFNLSHHKTDWLCSLPHERVRARAIVFVAVISRIIWSFVAKYLKNASLECLKSPNLVNSTEFIEYWTVLTV